MKTRIASASRIIPGAPGDVYRILADYRDGHPQILPRPYFQSLDVEQGGFGEGTIIRVSMRLAGQTRSFRARVAEPEPGYLLSETDLASGTVTWFRVSPADSLSLTEVRISTELKGHGPFESFLAKLLLQHVYREELGLLARLADGPPPPGQSPSQRAGPWAAAGETGDG